MNAREAMQALLDGKTVYTKIEKPELRHKIKLADDGSVIILNPFGDKKWEPELCLLNHVGGIVEEYPLTFEEALRAMLDGKVVKSERCRYPTRFHNGIFESAHASDCFTRWEQDGMPSFRQNAKWKVVE